jgi:zinc transporter
VWAFRVDEGRSIEVAFGDRDALNCQLHGSQNAWYWFHFDLGDRRAPRTLRLLLEELRAVGVSLPETAIAGFLQVLANPELHFTQGVVHGGLLDSVIDVDGARSGERALLSTAVGPRLVLTGRRRHLRGVEAVRSAARAGRLGERPISVISSLVRLDTRQRMSSFEQISDALNRIEDLVLGESGEIDRAQVIRIRHTLVRQHRELDSLRRLFERLDHEIRQESGPSMQRDDLARVSQWDELASLLQHLVALVDRCLALLDRARLLQQEVSDQLTVQTNRQLYVLSILTAALVPPTIVVGLFGMNTGGLPLTETPLGFVTAVALCALSSLGVLGALAGMGLIRRPKLPAWTTLFRRSRTDPRRTHHRGGDRAQSAASFIAPLRHD